MLFRMLDWWKQYKLDMIAAQSKAENAHYDAMVQVVAKQNDFITRWLDQFKMTDVPTSTVVRDVDEWQAEQDREGGIQASLSNAVEAGFPDLQDLMKDLRR